MGIFSWLIPGNDHQLAETRYAGRESATDRAARKRREKHHSGSATKAARQGQNWDTKDRKQDRKGPWYQAAR